MLVLSTAERCVNWGRSLERPTSGDFPQIAHSSQIVYNQAAVFSLTTGPQRTPRTRLGGGQRQQPQRRSEVWDV